MKLSPSILLLFLHFAIIGQVPATKKSKYLRVIRTGFHYGENKNLETIKWKKTKTSLKNFKFSFNGRILEKTEFGKHHNYDLKLIDNIEIYVYDSLNRLVMSKERTTGYNGNTEFKCYSKYNYDFRNNLISNITYQKETDSIFFQWNYYYNKSNLLIKSTNDLYTYLNQFDANGRITSETMLWDNNSKTNWIKNYKYTNDTITTSLVRFFRDSAKTTSLSIYDIEGRLIEESSVTDTKETNYGNKITYHYDQKGFLERINYYRKTTKLVWKKYDYKEIPYWKLESFINYNIKGKIKNKDNIKRMNLLLIENK